MQFVCVWFDLHSDMPFSCALYFRLLFPYFVHWFVFHSMAFCCWFRVKSPPKQSLYKYKMVWHVLNFLLLYISFVPLILCTQFTKVCDFDDTKRKVEEEKNHRTKKENGWNRDWVARLKVQHLRMVIITRFVCMRTRTTDRTPPFVMKKVKSQFERVFRVNFYTLLFFVFVFFSPLETEMFVMLMDERSWSNRQRNIAVEWVK